MIERLTLRSRLLISYIVLLVLTLMMMVVILLLFFSARPAPTEPTFNRIAAIVQGINIRDLLDEFAPDQASIPSDIERISAILEDFATTRSVRVMWLAQVDGRQFVVYDTANVYESQMDIMVTNESYMSTNLEQTLSPGSNQIYGSFRDPNGQEWLYGGVARKLSAVRRREVTSLFLVAEPRPTFSLREVLNQFSSSIFPPLVQAGLLGLLLAIGMAALISRSLVRPLQNLLMGVNEVAKGNYQQVVPEEGAPEVRELAHAFNFMSHEVLQSQQSQRDFLANVSHDLKTPLTSIQGYAQAIIDGAVKDPSSAAKIIYEESSRLNRLVVELTDLIRMQAGRLSLKMTALDFNIIVSAICERLSVVAQKKQIELVVHTQSIPTVAGDGDRLAQVLTNLISNAIKFTPVGGKIFVITRPVGTGVELMVRDTGIGIPPDDLPRIFERFYQVDKARGPQRGTGLGLAITQEIVHAHGGTITVYSEGSNKGTTFTIHLPIPDLSTIISAKRVGL